MRHNSGKISPAFFILATYRVQMICTQWRRQDLVQGSRKLAEYYVTLSYSNCGVPEYTILVFCWIENHMESKVKSLFGS